MGTLLLRLQGPMQSWGVQSRFGVRDTAREPSKSGVIGLLCAALGRNRTEPVEDLAGLRMGVRIDREGQMSMDFHTANNVLKAAGKPGTASGLKNTEISRRYYLADATFLVGFESENLSMLEELHTALRSPVWPLFLGRKAFVPSPPVYLPDGLRTDESLEEALRIYPRLVHPTRQDCEQPLRIILDDPEGEIVRPDRPVSFARRQFAPRRVRVDWIELECPPTPEKEAAS